MTEIDFSAAVEDAYTKEDNSVLMDRMREFAFGNQAVIEADKPNMPDWSGVPIPVEKDSGLPRPEGDRNDEQAGEKERPFFIPNAEDREKGEGGVFGNAAQAVVNGMVEGVNNTLEAAYQAARFWDDRFGGRILPQELPDIPQPFDLPDTTVNSVISSVSQFVLPFSVAGKAMKAAKLGSNVAASFPKAMKVVRPMIQGAIADFSAFDAHEKRLSNLIQNVPALRNPVTQYLSADDKDGQLEGRFKNAVEGLGLGALTDAFVKGVKAVKAARIAKAKAKAEGVKAVEDMFVPKINKEDLSALGDVDAGVIAKVKRDVFVDDKVAEKLGVKAGPLHLTEERRTHILENHLKQIQKEGFDTVDDYIDYVSQNYDAVYNDPKTSERFWFTVTKNGKHNNAMVVEAVIDNETGFFDVITAFPRKKIDFKGKINLLSDGAPSRQIPKNPPSANLGQKQVSKNNIAKKAESVNSEDVYINFARIDTPDDIKKVMDELAQKDAANINKARRGKMTFEEIKLNAEQEDAFKVLMERRAGEPLNAEQSFAARQLWAASSAKLKELSRLALENPSEANQFMLRKQMATHYAIQKEIIAARTETARALAQWKIPAGAPEEMYQAMKDVLESAGGDEVTRKMAADIMSMNEKGLVKELDKAIEMGFWAKVIATWNEARIAGLLTNTTTHIVNFTSNMMNVGLAMVDDVFTAGTAKMFGGRSSAEASDALLRLHGVVEGMKDGLRCAWKTIRTGTSDNPYATKFDLPPVIRSETYGLDRDSFWGRSVDMIGKIIRVPYNALEAADDFAKAVHGRGALYVEAAQKARNEIMSGTLTKDGFKARVADLVENPPVDLRMAAKSDAEYLTFTGAPSELTRHLGQIANKYPLVRFFLPFTKTPGNVLDFALQHSAFAPMSQKFRADIAAGGARAQRAIGQMSTGAAISMVGMDLALNGLITGGGPAGAERQALLRTGWQPYSIKIGGTYYSFQRFEPIATDLSLMADMAEFLTADRYSEVNAGEYDDPDVMTMGSLLMLKAGNAVLNKTYMSGMMDIVDALADPTENKAKKLAAAGLISLVPGLSSSLALSGAIARTTDPYAKDAADTMEQLKAGLPGFSKDVADRLDLFGRKISRATGNFAYDMFIPVRKSEESQEPIDKEMLAQGAFVPMPARKISIAGGVINLKYRPKLYNEYVALAGNELKLNDGMGAKDYLNAVVTGKIDVGYQNMNDGGLDILGSKANFIREVMTAYRRAAAAEMIRRHPEFLTELNDSRMRRVPQ